MNDKLDLFIDEYPPDLYRGPVFCMGVVDVSAVLSRDTNSLDFSEVLLSPGVRAYLGYVDTQKEVDILNYKKNKIFSEKDDINGPNMFWSTMAIYCVVGFLKIFYKFNSPSVNLFHDPKTMSDEHRLAMHDFLKLQIPKWFDTFSDGRAKPHIVNIQEGEKNSIGIKVADFITREFVKNGAEQLKRFPSVILEDLSCYVAENPKQLSFGDS